MQCAQAWASVLASLPGSWLLAVDTMPAFMQSSKLHLSLFQTEVAWRSGLEHAATQHLFMREAANFFSPLEYRLFTTVLNSNGSKTVFSPIVVGRTYQAPGSILREEEGEPGQDDQLAQCAQCAHCAAGAISWRVELVLANLKREVLTDVLSPHFPQRPGGVYFTHPRWPWLTLVRSRGTQLRVCGSPATAHRDFTKALQDTWCRRP